jgi:heme-degrading monooxygenase HmoA
LIWDSTEQLEEWFNSPEYKKARAIGEKYAKYRNFAVAGIPH